MRLRRNRKHEELGEVVGVGHIEGGTVEVTPYLWSRLTSRAIRQVRRMLGRRRQA